MPVGVACAQEQEEQRVKMVEEIVANNKKIDELESSLLNRITSTYRCIIDDAEFISGLVEIKVSTNTELTLPAKRAQ